MRAALSLYALDRPALVALSGELRALLCADDRAGLAGLLEVGAAFADRLSTGPRAVDWFLRPEADPEAAPLFASLRRVAKRRALEQAWTSPSLSLEGRLRSYDLLRAEREVAALIDRLLDPGRLPWFLVRPGATGGWLDGERRDRLASELAGLRDALPPEIAAFADALGDIEGDVIAHDML